MIGRGSRTASLNYFAIDTQRDANFLSTLGPAGANCSRRGAKPTGIYILDNSRRYFEETKSDECHAWEILRFLPRASRIDFWNHSVWNLQSPRRPVSWKKSDIPVESRSVLPRRRFDYLEETSPGWNLYLRTNTPRIFRRDLKSRR